MAEKPKTAGGGQGEEISPPEQQFELMNNPEVKKAIKQHVSFMKAKESERRVINAEIAQSRNGLLDRGLNKAGIAWIESYSKMKDSKKKDLDATFIIAREAIGDPIQMEMFSKPKKKGQAAAGKKKDEPSKPAAKDDDGAPAPAPVH